MPLTPNAQQLDFSRTGFTQTVTLATGTDDLIGWFSNVALPAELWLEVQNISGSALTGLKMQVRHGSEFEWKDYLEGADWVSPSNGAQRSWSGEVDPSTLAVGVSAAGGIEGIGYKQCRFLASGVAGTVLRVVARSSSAR